MKKLIFTFIGLVIGLGAFAQTLTDWTNANPGNITLTQETTTVNEGTTALGLTSTTQSQADTEVISASFTVTPGAIYTASVDVMDDDIAGRIRLAMSFDGSNEWGPYSTDGASWETIEMSDT